MFSKEQDGACYVFVSVATLSQTEEKPSSPLQHIDISSRYRDYYVGMTQVQNGVLYIGYRGART